MTTAEDTPRAATPEEARELHAAGWFRWGFGSWIHELDLGDVWPTDRALELKRADDEPNLSGGQEAA